MTHLTESMDNVIELKGYREPMPTREFVVVHPLFDEPEAKVDVAHLGPMELSLGARLALGSLRLYLVAMILLAGYRVMDFAGVFKH